MYSNILPLVQTCTNLHFDNLVHKVVSFLQNIRIQFFMHLFVPVHTTCTPHLIVTLLITQHTVAKHKISKHFIERYILPISYMVVMYQLVDGRSI